MQLLLGEHLDIARAINSIGSDHPDQAFVLLGGSMALLQREMTLFLFDCTDLARTTSNDHVKVLQ